MALRLVNRIITRPKWPPKSSDFQQRASLTLNDSVDTKTDGLPRI